MKKAACSPKVCADDIVNRLLRAGTVTVQTAGARDCDGERIGVTLLMPSESLALTGNVDSIGQVSFLVGRLAQVAVEALWQRFDEDDELGVDDLTELATDLLGLPGDSPAASQVALWANDFINRS